MVDRAGCLIRGANGNELRYFSYLPRYISVDIPGYLAEFFLRLDPRCKPSDLRDRMQVKFKPSPNAFQMRHLRFRKLIKSYSWGCTSEESAESELTFLSSLQQAQFDANTCMPIDRRTGRFMKPQIDGTEITGYVLTDLPSTYFLSSGTDKHIPSQRMINNIKTLHILQTCALQYSLGNRATNWVALPLNVKPGRWSSQKRAGKPPKQGSEANVDQSIGGASEDAGDSTEFGFDGLGDFDETCFALGSHVNGTENVDTSSYIPPQYDYSAEAQVQALANCMADGNSMGPTNLEAPYKFDHLLHAEQMSTNAEAQSEHHPLTGTRADYDLSFGKMSTDPDSSSSRYPPPYPDRFAVTTSPLRITESANTPDSYYGYGHADLPSAASTYGYPSIADFLNTFQRADSRYEYNPDCGCERCLRTQVNDEPAPQPPQDPQTALERLARPVFPRNCMKKQGPKETPKQAPKPASVRASQQMIVKLALKRAPKPFPAEAPKLAPKRKLSETETEDSVPEYKPFNRFRINKSASN